MNDPGPGIGLASLAPYTVDELDVLCDALEGQAIGCITLLRQCQPGSVRDSLAEKLSVTRSLLTNALETHASLGGRRPRCDQAWEMSL